MVICLFSPISDMAKLFTFQHHCNDFVNDSDVTFFCILKEFVFVINFISMLHSAINHWLFWLKSVFHSCIFENCLLLIHNTASCGLVGANYKKMIHKMGRILKPIIKHHCVAPNLCWLIPAIENDAQKYTCWLFGMQLAPMHRFRRCETIDKRHGLDGRPSAMNVHEQTTHWHIMIMMG